MAAPVLTLTAISMHDSGPMALTDLTGGSAGANALVGYNVTAPLVGSTGAAWMVPAYGQILSKSGSGGILSPTYFGTHVADGPAGGPGWLQTYRLDDEENNFGHGGGSGYSDIQTIDGMNSWNFTGSNCGVQWSLPTDQKLRLFTAFLYTDGGSWQVEATMSDSSISASPLVLGGAHGVLPNASFTVAYRAVEANSTLLLKIRNPSNTVGSTSAILSRAYYIGVPTAPAHPRGAGRVRTYTNLYGGSN